VGNFGIAILIVATILKLIFSPFANSSYRAMSKIKLLQPQIDAIRQKFPEDKAQENKEIMQLYKRENVSAPSGCLPILVQWFIFFMVYKALVVPLEIRHAPFGWINDLTAPDPTNIFNLFGLIPFDPVLYFDFLHLGAWPVITGVTLWLLQRRISPALYGPKLQQGYRFLPFLVPFLLKGLPAGWVMFLAWYNLLSIVHQWLLMGKISVVGNISEYSADVLPHGKTQPIIFLANLAPVTQGIMLFVLLFSRPSKSSLGVAVPDAKATTAKSRRSWFPIFPHKTAKQVITGANAKSNVPEDHAEAIERYREAAEQGDAEAQSILGLMYFTGRGVLQDYVEAHMWLNLAASRFSTAEIRNLDQAIRDRDHVAAKMTPAQIAEAQRLAREWKPKPGTTANVADTVSGSERVSFDKIMKGTGQSQD
jgi:YidC/Oxa1 family membrane protein insertase